MASTSNSVIASSQAIGPASKVATESFKVVYPAFSAYVEAQAAAEQRQKQGEPVAPTDEGVKAGSKAFSQNLPACASHVAKIFA